MRRWEYGLWTIDAPHQQDDHDMLDGFGREGWEMYAVTVHEDSRGTHFGYHMRRPLETPHQSKEPKA